MEENNKGVNKFEMSKFSQFFYKNYHIGGLLIIVIQFILIILIVPKSKYNLIDSIKLASIYSGILYLFVLLGVLRTWRARMAYVLTVDAEKKEFSAYIYDRKKEIKFMVNDVREIRREPTQGGFRFYFNDGTWITWDSYRTNLGQLLEENVRLLGISIRTKSFW